MYPAIHDPRLVLEAPSLVDRRALYVALKKCVSPVRAHMHLTPQSKANKTLVYFTARRSPVEIEDMGDIVTLSWKTLPAKNTRIDLSGCAAEVEASLSTFLGDRPSDPRPIPQVVPEWRRKPRGGHPAHRGQGHTMGRQTRNQHT